MINLLKDWALQIVIVTLFVTFIEIILPNNSMKRYIKVIIGLLIIIVIINPFINIFSKDIDIDKEVFANIIKGGEYDTAIFDEFTNKNDKQIIEIYKEKFKNQITQLIEDNTDYTVEEIFLDIVEEFNDSNFGSIKGLTIVLSSDKENESQEEDKVKIREIKVSVGNVSHKFEKQSENQFHRVKDVINASYSIPKDDITIYMNNNRGG